MTLSDIASIRLHSQQITNTELSSPQAIVAWMGAMQAQDYQMSLWAVGCRLPQSTMQTIQKAFDDGAILRTHVMRPTWHLVSADDIYWMLELTAPRIKAVTRIRDSTLGIQESHYVNTNALLKDSLSGGKQLTTDELKMIFEKEKIDTKENRFYHYMMKAELDAIVCSGAIKNKKQTYALLSDRVPKPQRFSRDESLAKLAERYFKSHGPATLKDFVWWSGLSVSDARKGLERVTDNFKSEKIESETYWFDSSIADILTEESSVYVLPAFDEYIISYKKRNAIISAENQKMAFSSNGIFRPLIVIDGQVTGIWKRTTKKNSVVIEPTFFYSKAISHSIIEKAIQAYGKYLDKPIEF